ncbi:MAG: DNA methyltransferase [Planctomycetota bacterium]
MSESSSKCRPGEVRDAIVRVLSAHGRPLPVKEIEEGVSRLVEDASPSSVRSYLRLNTPEMFVREERGVYGLQLKLRRRPRQPAVGRDSYDSFTVGNATLVHADCFDWLEDQPDRSIHAIVTDPPYGLHEYSPEQQTKLRNGRGGVWRIPPSFDGSKRSPVPRFTTLTQDQLEGIRDFFYAWTQVLLPKLVPGANVVVASNPLLSYLVSFALAEAGLERRGEITRLVTTMRGGDRPKGAHKEFAQVSVMPRAMWEPWLVYRRPLVGRVQDNLREWKTGGFRRPSRDKPFGDVIRSAPTRKEEREQASHPSLKPQRFMRTVVRAVLPLGEGVVVDPFAGAGSTLAAAEAVGYASIGIEKDEHYFEMARKAIPKLAQMRVRRKR